MSDNQRSVASEGLSARAARRGTVRQDIVAQEVGHFLSKIKRNFRATILDSLSVMTHECKLGSLLGIREATSLGWWPTLPADFWLKVPNMPEAKPIVATKQPVISKTIMCIGFILFGIPSAIFAANKGFKPLRWLLAFGAIGLIVVCCLSSAKAKDITAEESATRAAKANSIGAVMCGINLALGAVSLLILLANN